MRGHPGKEVGCPQKQWMTEAGACIMSENKG